MTVLLGPGGLHRGALDALPSPLWLADDRGDLSFVNRAWAERTGLGDGVGPGVSFVRGLHPEDRAAALARWAQAWAAGTPTRETWRLGGRDGCH